MAETASTMLPLGTTLPSFSLPDAVSGLVRSEGDVKGARGTLVMFICNHCPYVKHVVHELGRLAGDYAPKGIGVVAINSNDVDAYPQDGPENMRSLANAEGWDFPFLYDETQEVAKSFRAACTPDFFAFDAGGRLAYRGQLDPSRPGSQTPVTGRDLREALDAILAGRKPNADQKPSLGCNIKWKPGQKPDYFG
jgi:thiol-disulfide isomerase/thioredoxin